MNLFVLPTERYDGGTYTVTGNVESFLTKSNGRFYYKLHVTHIDEPVQDVDFSVRLSHSEAFPAGIGDTVTCEAKFFAFEDSLGLSPRTSWLADNMVLSAYVTDYESVQVTPVEKRPFSYYVNQIRTHFHNLILETTPKSKALCFPPCCSACGTIWKPSLSPPTKRPVLRTFWPYPACTWRS